jgi:hypothetical protein
VNRQRRINHAQYVEFNLQGNVPSAAKALTYEILKIKLVKKEHFDLIKEVKDCAMDANFNFLQ